MSAVAQVIDVNAAVEAEQELTDGFHLVIDALKLNGIETIYGVPGIPITDLGRMAQAEGIRVVSFRHEQNAGNAAAIAGFLTKKPGVCLTVSAPGFLNGLTALANATTNCFPMILISGSSEREIVDLQQGDYEEMDQLAIAKPLCKAAFRVLHAADIGIGVARAIRAAVSGRPGGVYLDLPAKLFSQVMDAAEGEKSLVKVIDAAPEQLPSPAAIKRALDVLKSAKKPLVILGKGAAYAQADEEIRSFIEKTASESGLKITIEQVSYFPPCPFEKGCVDAVESGAKTLGYSYMNAVSGAGHDAVYMARLAPAGMIFVPCKDGISHNEIEDAKPEHLEAGCNVLLHAMLDRARTA